MCSSVQQKRSAALTAEFTAYPLAAGVLCSATRQPNLLGRNPTGQRGLALIPAAGVNRCPSSKEEPMQRAISHAALIVEAAAHEAEGSLQSLR